MRHLRLISLICILGLLSGCGLIPQIGPQDSAGQTAEGSAEVELESPPPMYTDASPVVLWGRDQLSVHAQRAYDRIDQAVAALSDKPLEVDVTEDEIDLILTAMRIDHPEYFWFDGNASFVTTTVEDVTVKTECTLNYTMDLPEIQQAHQRIQQYTAACLSSLRLSGAQTDYERILAVYRYLIETTDYLVDETDQSILSVMLSHQATCAGYARSFQYLMNQLGIPCTLALGEGSAGEAHGWNIVSCGGDWYQMDVTWGDPVDPDDNPGNSIQYTYCMITDEEIYRDHTLTSPIRMPVCTATEFNYYVQSGRQFEQWDLEAYAYAMADAVEAGEEWFAVRFTSADAYEDAARALFTEETIWSILSWSGAAGTDQNHVTYTQNDQFFEISVRLDGNGGGSAS